MQKWNWIKMGLKMLKMLLIIVVIVLTYATININVNEFNKKQEFRMTVGVLTESEVVDSEKEEVKEETPKNPEEVVKQPEKEIKKEEKKEQKIKQESEDKSKGTVKEEVSSISTLTGSLTGYAADCPACSGKLACNSNYDVYKNNVVTYNDKGFGNVRIVASSKSLPCGSIIKFNLKSISNEPVIAVVLDRGVRGQDIDLLMPTEDAARKLVGRKTIKYEVLRNGW